MEIELPFCEACSYKSFFVADIYTDSVDVMLELSPKANTMWKNLQIISIMASNALCVELYCVRI